MGSGRWRGRVTVARVKRVLLALLLVDGLLVPRAASAANQLGPVRVRADGAAAEVELAGTEAPRFTTTSADGSLVIDFAGAKIASAVTKGAGPVRRVRSEAPGRVVLELEPGAEAQ